MSVSNPDEKENGGVFFSFSNQIRKKKLKKY